MSKRSIFSLILLIPFLVILACHDKYKKPQKQKSVQQKLNEEHNNDK